ncbi:MAG: DUF86 domain-containing protein [Vicinamibacterales bacterium]|nr:DUF86 domain-containing protein [Vicinamibacterales bacterium]
MTDRALVEKRLALIETCLADLRRLARPEKMVSDVREERFIEHTLQLAIQAALDVASHIVSDRRLGEPRSNRELFLLLERDGWLPSDMRVRLADMAGFRNILVHGYDDVDLSVVEDVVTTRLVDLEGFVASIRQGLNRAT